MANGINAVDLEYRLGDIETDYCNRMTPDLVRGRAVSTAASPPMPVEAVKHLTHSDALAIAAYLTTLPAVKHKVRGPFDTTEKPTSFVLPALPPAQVLCRRLPLRRECDLGHDLAMPFGSKANMAASLRYVCFTPESGHVRRVYEFTP